MSLSVTPNCLYIPFESIKVLVSNGVDTNFNDFNEHPFNIYHY